MTEENKKSLMKRTKSELIEIIARKDDTEQKYASTIKELEKNVADLSDEVALKINVIKSYEEGNNEFGTECETLNAKLKQVEYDKNQLQKHFDEYQKDSDHSIKTIKSRLNTVQEEKEDLQVKCAEWEANYDEVYCESNKYKGICRILTVLSVALLGAVVLMIF